MIFTALAAGSEMTVMIASAALTHAGPLFVATAIYTNVAGVSTQALRIERPLLVARIT